MSEMNEMSDMSEMSEMSDMSKIGDHELIKEFYKRFLLLQFHTKTFLELLVSPDEEISQEKYEKFKTNCFDNNLYKKVDEIIQEAWDDFDYEEEEEVNGVCAGCGCEHANI